LAVTTIAALHVADDADAWRSAGFSVTDDGCLRLGSVRVELEHEGQGIIGWVLAGAPDDGVTEVDGLATAHGQPDDAAPCDHGLGVRRIDHVVVMTPDVDRTAGAITRALGVPLKRVREGVSMDRPVRQAFFRLGEVILELVGPPEPGDGPARFWGLALVLDDLDTAYAAAGPDRMSEPKRAVQPGRRIARLRGLGMPVAVMDDPGH
jgi:hypothetical protein